MSWTQKRQALIMAILDWGDILIEVHDPAIQFQ
jgi:hypothetical protein